MKTITHMLGFCAVLIGCSSEPTMTLDDPDPYIRHKVMSKMSNAEMRQNTHKILDMAQNDPDLHLRVSALGQLGRTCEPPEQPCHPDILPLLEQTLRPESSPFTNDNAIMALVGIGGEDACRILVAAFISFPEQNSTWTELQDVMKDAHPGCDEELQARQADAPERIRPLLKRSRQ